MGKMDGHCLCGNVTYTVDEGTEPMMVGLCHCTDCQRQTGTTFSIVVLVDEAAFHVSGDSISEWRTVNDETGADVIRKFCGNCGSPIASLPQAMEGIAAIKAGTLDDKTWLEPEGEFYCSSAQPWYKHDEELGIFPRGVPT